MKFRRLQETELFIADDPLARQETLRENVSQAVDSERRRLSGKDDRATLTGATVRKNKPPYRGRRRKGP